MELPVKYFLAAVIATAAVSGGASAHPRLEAQIRSPVGLIGADQATGAAPDLTVGFGGGGRDLQGRTLSSSSRGNAQFPERPATAQNLGSTSGGPAY